MNTDNDTEEERLEVEPSWTEEFKHIMEEVGIEVSFEDDEKEDVIAQSACGQAKNRQLMKTKKELKLKHTNSSNPVHVRTTEEQRTMKYEKSMATLRERSNSGTGNVVRTNQEYERIDKKVKGRKLGPWQGKGNRAEDINEPR